MYIVDHYNEAEGLHLYHVSCRGHNEVHAAFYDWHNTRPLLRQHFDQPHDYFVYRDEADRIAMVEKFGDFITIEPTKQTWETAFPSGPPLSEGDQAIAAELMALLTEEIQKEINREILTKLGMLPPPTPLTYEKFDPLKVAAKMRLPSLRPK